MNETNTTTLPVHITPHHLRLSPALSDFVRRKLVKVPRFASDVLATDIVLRRHHGTADGKLFSASARLALAGRDIHATATHADLYTAIVKLVARLARRSRKRKTRLAKRHVSRRRAESRKPQCSHDQPASIGVLDSEPAHAEMRNARHRNGGQEQRVFGFRRTAPFAFHQT
jgi:putative sigma-54 modulation protein